MPEKGTSDETPRKGGIRRASAKRAGDLWVNEIFGRRVRGWYSAKVWAKDSAGLHTIIFASIYKHTPSYSFRVLLAGTALTYRVRGVATRCETPKVDVTVR